MQEVTAAAEGAPPPPSTTELRTELWFPLLGYTLVFSTRERMAAFGNQYPEYNSSWRDASSGRQHSAIARMSLDGGDMRVDGRQRFCEPPSGGYAPS